MHSRRHNLIWIAPLALLAIPAFAFIGGAVVQALWNWLLPPILGWPAIGFWQALGLLVLARILFGGVRSIHGGRRDRSAPDPRPEIL